MLNIQTVAHLARLLETTPRRLIEVADSASSYYEELILIDPARPDKVRDILNVRGCLRRLQGLLHDKVLVPAHRPSMYSHGGIRGRNIKSNATKHLRSTFLYTTRQKTVAAVVAGRASLTSASKWGRATSCT